jgi:hypothetical protein
MKQGFFFSETTTKGKTMAQIVTSVSRIRPGDVIKAIPGERHNEKARKIGKVEPCPGNPESVHLDHECYDMRFTTFLRVES